MPSPFPGMEPYLESPKYRAGFHTKNLVALLGLLTEQLPEGFYAEVKHHIRPEDDDREAFAYPDSFLNELPGGTAVATRPLKATQTSAETRLEKPIKKKAHKYGILAEAESNRTITVLELLTPANKLPGSDRDSHLAKRDDDILSGTHLVEIDLLRSGDRIPMGRPLPPPSDYYAMITRSDRFPGASVWAMTVRDALPVLPISLKPNDGEIDLDLRAALDLTFHSAGYLRRVDYHKPAEPPLRKPDAEWADTYLPKPASPKKRAK